MIEAVQPELPVEADGQVDGDRLLAFLPVAGPECAFVPSYRMFNGRFIDFRNQEKAAALLLGCGLFLML